MPPATEPLADTSTFRIKVAGQDLSTEEANQVVEVTVDQDLMLPATFTIRLRDISDNPQTAEQTYFGVLDGGRFRVGAATEIGFGYETNPETVLKAEVTSIELEATAAGVPVLTVRGYDRSRRLHRERKARTFKNVSDSDIVSRVAREYGLTPAAEATPTVHDHVYQHNQTDWEFLRSRANRVGYELFVDDRRLVFRKPAAPGQPPEHELRQTLHRVRLRVSAPSQVQEVTVKGWDPKNKRAIVGTARQATQRPKIGETQTGGQMAGPLGTGKFVVADPAVASQSEAATLAKSIFDEIAGDFIQLEGVCLGDHRLRAGGSVKLTGIGRRYSGEYYLSAVSHRWSAGEGHVTHFTVSGRRPHTLGALLGAAAATGAAANGKGAAGYPGVVVGIVTNNKPPASEMQGQVKVNFPWLVDDTAHESAWARLASPMAGNGRGFYFVPEVNDEVLVAFEHGDINRPYVVGAVWNGRDKPPKDAAQVVDGTGKVYQRIIKSRLGHTITLDDSDNSPSITIVDRTEKNSIKLESQTNKMTVAVEGDIVLEAPKGTVTIKGKTVDVQATTDLKLKGASTNVEATNALTAKGATTNVEATGTLGVKAGATGKVEANGILEVKGGVVKIN
jgi:phage protein D